MALRAALRVLRGYSSAPSALSADTLRMHRVLALVLLLPHVLAAVADQSAVKSAPLWFDVTKEAIGSTTGWTNKVEIADINGDGRPDLLFANGGNYSEPGTPEVN